MANTFTCCGFTCCPTIKTPMDTKVLQEDVKSLYNSMSAIYDIWGTLAESRARKRAIELAGIKDGQSILEVAVGTGLAFYEIVKRNPNGMNIGIDISEGMLKKAQKRMDKIKSANYELKIGSAFEISYPDSTFDLLINNYMFDLIAFNDMERILIEFRRVLKKDGKLVLVNMTVGERFGSGIYDFIYRFSPKTMGGCRSIKMVEKLNATGFYVITREYYQQLLFPSEVILAKK